jgi:hypothetical protein
VFLVFLAACAQELPVCSEPYILIDDRCCLDKDNSSICDADEGALGAPERLDCSLCPPQFVTQKEEVIVYRYVCANESVVDKPEKCAQVIASNAGEFRLSKEQDASFIEEFEVRPACRGKFNAAEVLLQYAQRPLSITLQLLDEPEGEWRDVAKPDVKADIFYYIGFCLDCQNLIDLKLESTSAYAIRAVLQYPDYKVYSRELIIDPTPSGLIGKKVCS